MEDGGKATEGHRGHYTSLTFKAVDIIGSPASATYEALASTGFCSPSTTPYMPYFVSQADPFWIEPVVESPLVGLFAWRKVGVPGANFGSIFPRVGFMHQAHGYKAAALAAQRAADIVTNRLQPHLYQPMLANAEPGYWPPGRIIENQPFNHAWQALSPAGSGTAPCTVFGEIPDAALPLDPYAARVAPSENYAWHLWRRYACCEREGAALVYHTPI